MGQARGSAAQLAGGVKEAVYGTTPGTPAGINLPIISCGIQADQKLIVPNVIRGRRDAYAPSRGNQGVAGPVVVPVDAINFGHWLQMLIGQPTPTGAGPYTHTFKTGELASWVLEAGYPDLDTPQYELFNGCKAKSMSLSLDQSSDAAPQATFNIVGGKSTWSGTPMDSSLTTQAYSPFSLSDITLSEGGSSLTTAQSVSIEVENNLDESVFCLGGGGVRADLPEGIANAKGTIKAMFDSMSLLNKAINGTESSIIVTFTNGTNVLVLEFNEIKYAVRSVGIPGPEGLWVELNWEAYFENHADNAVVVATLTNSLAAYPA